MKFNDTVGILYSFSFTMLKYMASKILLVLVSFFKCTALPDNFVGHVRA